MITTSARKAGASRWSVGILFLVRAQANGIGRIAELPWETTAVFTCRLEGPQAPDIPDSR
jgi:hypothetical protein